MSVRLDPKAFSLLAKAYAAKGGWVGDYLAPPGPRARAWAASLGIDLYERDRWGELRYIRAYKRAVFYNLWWYGGPGGLRAERNLTRSMYLRGQWETGLIMRLEGHPHWGEWAVRFRIHQGNSAKTSRDAKERATRLNENWMGADGKATFRQSTPEDRDY